MSKNEGLMMGVGGGSHRWRAGPCNLFASSGFPLHEPFHHQPRFGLQPSRFLAPVSIELCSITETLESQVAGMCTIDSFHCGSQQWLFAPQHTAPQEEPGEHTETQSPHRIKGACPALLCTLSKFMVFLCHWSHCGIRTHCIL